MAEDQDKNKTQEFEKILDDIIEQVFKDFKFDDEKEDKEEE